MRARVDQLSFARNATFTRPTTSNYKEGSRDWPGWVCYHTGPVVQFVHEASNRLISVPLAHVYHIEYADGLKAFEDAGTGAKGKTSR